MKVKIELDFNPDDNIEVVEAIISSLQGAEVVGVREATESKRISVAEAAQILNKSQQFIRVGLQRNTLPIGSAVFNGKWSYHITDRLLNKYLEGR